MQEQLWNQLVQTLHDKASLSPEQAQQVAQVVSDFAQQHLGDLLKLGAEQGGAGGMLGGLGSMFNRG